ncbi:MAG: hypothetical protein RLW87_06975 [Alphaproteobacteria bacterium]
MLQDVSDAALMAYWNDLTQNIARIEGFRATVRAEAERRDLDIPLPPTPKMPVETQQTVADWGWETFGPAPIPHIAARVVGEASELIRIATKGVRLEDFTMEQRAAMTLEAADVAIFLMRFADLCHFDLAAAVDEKMAINRTRKWEMAPDGRHIKASDKCAGDQGDV